MTDKREVVILDAVRSPIGRLGGILTGEGDLYLAGGVESMSRAAWVIGKPAAPFQHGNVTAYDTSLGWRFPNPSIEKRIPLLSMGETAENIAEKYNISRKEQDRFACESHKKAVKARDTIFSEEIIPIPIPRRKAPMILADKDETPRDDTSLEKLAVLPPIFRTRGTVTAGNSSGLNDGAALLILASREKAASLGKKPMARWLGCATAALDPSYMGLGPVFSTNKILKRLGMHLEDIDIIEINEAFAVQVLSCIRDLNISEDKINPNGGAIALGHPLGSSGARVLTTLLHEMKRRQFRLGLATLCIGVGQGISTIVGEAL